MASNLLPVDILILCTSIISLALAIVVLVKRVKPGGTSFASILISVAVWLFFRFLEGMSTELSQKVFWARFEYIGIATLPIFYILFAIRFSRNDKWVNRLNVLLLSLIPITTIILVFTNENHGLIWTDIILNELDGANNAIYTHGFFFWIHGGYSYLLLFFGAFLLIKTFLNFPESHRFQIVILITATLIPLIGNLLYIAGMSPVRGLDLTPIMLVFTNIILTFSLYKGQIFSIVPFARNIIFENLSEGIIVTNKNNQIVDFNKAAETILRVKGKDFLGKPCKELCSIISIDFDTDDNTESIREFCVDENEQRYIQVIFSKINEDKENSGKLISLHDISDRKKLELYEKEQRIFAEALADISATLNSTLDIDAVMEKMLEIIGKVVPHDAANIALIDEENRTHFVKLKGYEKFEALEELKKRTYLVDDVPNFMIMKESKQAVLIKDIHLDNDWVSSREIQWMRSYIGSPIITEGKVIGFINADSATPNFFTEEHANRLRVFSDQAAIALKNARYVKELERKNEDITTLYEVGMTLSEGLNFQEVIEGINRQLMRFPNLALFFLGMINEGQNTIEFHAYNLFDKPFASPAVSMGVNTSITGYTINQRKTIYIPDLHSSDSPIDIGIIVEFSTEKARTYLGVPLMQGRKVIGILAVMSEMKDALSPYQIRLIQTIAVQVAIAVENVRMFNRVQELATVDELTGIYNRRYFFLVAKNEIERSNRYKKDLSIILIDIDHYKNVNDEFGHIAGDHVLRVLTKTIQEELRTSDVFARYGGEEFLILLSETDGKGAQLVAERIREKVESMVVDYEDKKISITLSLGISQKTEERDTLTEILQSVDEALYEAKQQGRNRIHFIA